MAEFVETYSYPLTRTTLGEYFSGINCTEKVPGIYVVACYPSLGCLYVGISNNIHRRLFEHIYSNGGDELGKFIRENFTSSVSWRLDVFEIPDEEKRRKYERELVEKLHPMFNTHGLGETIPPNG